MVSNRELTVALLLGLLACANSLASPSKDDRSGKVEKSQDSSEPSSTLTCDDYPEYLEDSSECVNIDGIPDVIAAVEGNLALNTKDNRNLVQNTLDDFCNSQCYDNTVFLYSNCTAAGPPIPSFAQSRLDLYEYVVCGRNGGTYCAIAGIEDIANGDINQLEIELQCNTDEHDCPRQECIDILERISENLGCCAGNLFNRSISSLSPFLSILDDEYYENCNLTLPAPCSGSGFVSTTPVVGGLVLFVSLIFAF